MGWDPDPRVDGTVAQYVSDNPTNEERRLPTLPPPIAGREWFRPAG